MANAILNQLPVPLINFEIDLTTFPNKVTDKETDPKSDEEEQSHDNKQQISSKELSDSVKEIGSTNSILVTDSVTMPKQVHKKQRYDDKHKGHSKRILRKQ